LLGHADLRDRLVPRLVSQILLDGARVRRWHGLEEELTLAFATGAGGERRRDRQRGQAAVVAGAGQGLTRGERTTGDARTL